MTHELEILAERLAGPLEPAAFAGANRRYAARSLAELLHERMIEAQSGGEREHGLTQLTVSGDRPDVRWHFTARRRQLDYWSVQPDSIAREVNGRAEPVDALQLFIDLRRTLGVEPATLTRFLEETAQTLYADTCALRRGRPTARALAEADHQSVERAMEGHPWVVVNKGRVGFGALDQQRFAPESSGRHRLLWLAAHGRRAELTLLTCMDATDFYRRELGAEALARFRARLADRGHAPADYHFLPVHEWQWDQKIAPLFAADLASGALVPVGVSDDDYRPQQSIRTFHNASHPERCYVKTALSILNTFQVRGLDPVKLRLAPRVTEWLFERLRGDPELNERVTLLGEVATLAYEHPAFRQVSDGPYPYREMLGALWRESPLPHLGQGDQLATMASLLYVDDHGEAVVSAYARRAGISVEVWVARYLNAYLWPLLHCFFRHETYFVAHGENTILVLRDGSPARVVFKDLVEEVQVSPREHAHLPQDMQRLFYRFEERLLPLFILTDVFDAFFRYLADVLATHAGLPEARFWQLVARTIRDYERAHPELSEKYAAFDLFRAEFPRFCLNKYRLVYHGYADVADNVLDLDPKFSGTLDNPIAVYR